jgi:hypothetical protein
MTEYTTQSLLAIFGHVPRQPPGGWLPARPADRRLLVEWSEAFEAEAGVTSSADLRRDVELRLAEGRAFLRVDGNPASCVARRRRWPAW